MTNTQPKASILVVDDTPANVRLLMGLLGERGYHVRPATDGAYALSTASAEPPDVILLDIVMPQMDGYQVCERLKADERTREIPVIFISARDDTFDKVKAFAVGGVDYLTKPIQAAEALARIETHLALRKLQTHLADEVKERTAHLQQEIVERQRVEQSLRASEAQYRALAEQATDGIGILQHERVVFVNAALAELLGSTPQHLLEKTPLELFQGVSQTQFDIPAEPRWQTIELALNRDGQERWIEERHNLICWEGEDAFLVTMHDITERKRREQEMQTERERLRRENVRLRSTIRDRYRFGDLIGKSEAMQTVYELIAQAAATDANVVIYGESGVGKDVVARAIHGLSQRRKKPYIAVNCGSIVETLFESEFFGYRKGAFTGALRDKAGFFDAAHGGTLFLDEVGELNLLMQAKLLRAIETKSYIPVGDQNAKQADVRIIAATHRNLKERVKEGLMRQDFFYRIAVIPLTVPPLRERKEDIPLLVEYFLKEYSAGGAPPRLPGNVLDRFCERDWPGNIRQLQNVLQRYLTLQRLDIDDDVADTHGTPDGNHAPAPDALPLKDALEAFERQYILTVLKQQQRHKGNTAALLNIDLKTLYRKIKAYHID